MVTWESKASTCRQCQRMLRSVSFQVPRASRKWRDCRPTRPVTCLSRCIDCGWGHGGILPVWLNHSDHLLFQASHHLHLSSLLSIIVVLSLWVVAVSHRLGDRLATRLSHTGLKSNDSQRKKFTCKILLLIFKCHTYLVPAETISIVWSLVLVDFLCTSCYYQEKNNHFHDL